MNICLRISPLLFASIFYQMGVITQIKGVVFNQNVLIVSNSLTKEKHVTETVMVGEVELRAFLLPHLYNDQRLNIACNKKYTIWYTKKKSKC